MEHYQGLKRRIVAKPDLPYDRGANLKEFDNAGLGFGTGDEKFTARRGKNCPDLNCRQNAFLLSRN